MRIVLNILYLIIATASAMAFLGMLPATNVLGLAGAGIGIWVLTLLACSLVEVALRTIGESGLMG